MENNRTKNKIRIAIIGLVLLLIVVFVVRCSTGGIGKKVVFTTGFEKDEVFRIEDVSCVVPELMVYLTTTQNQYESVYGAKVWEVSLEGATLEDNVKETVLAKIAQIKTMYLLAEEKEVELDETEEEQVQKAAEEYFGSLGEKEKELLGITKELVVQMYREYALADKVYAFIIRDVNPEISDDEARTITVQHILLRTYVLDGAGNRAVYNDDLKESVYEKASSIREQAITGEQDFVELASKYSDDTNITYSFGKGDMDIVFEETAFRLETGEISEVFETDAGYHIIKCLSTFDREQTDLNKLEIVDERRREIFGQEYDAFVATLVRQLNEEVWEEVSLIHDEEVTTTGFFESYHKYFGQ